MIENVTDIVIARSREPEGLKTMIVWSIAGHIGLAALALLWGGARPEAPRTVMTVSLSGAPGPKTGGQTMIGGQTVQAPPPQEQPKPVETPPAPKAPVMCTARSARPPTSAAQADAGSSRRNGQNAEHRRCSARRQHTRRHTRARPGVWTEQRRRE